MRAAAAARRLISAGRFWKRVFAAEREGAPTVLAERPLDPRGAATPSGRGVTGAPVPTATDTVTGGAESPLWTGWEGRGAQGEEMEGRGDWMREGEVEKGERSGKGGDGGRTDGGRWRAINSRGRGWREEWR